MDKALYGVKGWLALLVIAMCLLGPLKVIGETTANIAAAEKDSPYLLALSDWATYKQASWVLVMIVCAILFFGGWRLWKIHCRRSVYLAIASLWTANIAVFVGDYVIASAVFGQAVADAAGNDIAPEIIKALTASTVWTAYLLLSRRVENTYPAGQYYNTSEAVRPLVRTEPTFGHPAKADRPTEQRTPTMDKYETLKKLKELLDCEVITQAEYESEKNKILEGRA